MEPVVATEVNGPEPAPETDGSWSPSRLECLGGVIVSPVRTFEHLAERPQWFLPLVVVLFHVLVSRVVPMLAMLYAFVPDMVEMTEGATAGFFGLAFFALIAAISLGMAVLFAFIVFSMMAAALYGIAKILKGTPKVFAIASTLAFAEFLPRLISVSIKEFLPLLSGTSHIFHSPELPTGIAPIFSKLDLPIVVEAFLARIELFHLWSFALVAIAVRFAAKVSSERAMLITLLYWIVCVLAIAGGGAIREMLSSFMMG